MSQSTNPLDSQTQESPSAASDTWAYEHIARSQTCPVCFGTVAKQHTRENRNVMLATYVCINDHLFEVRWGLAQVTA